MVQDDRLIPSVAETPHRQMKMLLKICGHDMQVEQCMHAHPQTCTADVKAVDALHVRPRSPSLPFACVGFVHPLILQPVLSWDLASMLSCVLLHDTSRLR